MRGRLLTVYVTIVLNLILVFARASSEESDSDCETCECIFPAVRQGICGPYTVSCGKDPSCLGRWTGPIADPDFCRRRCEEDNRCAFYSKWEDNGCRTYQSCGDENFLAIDQVTTHQRLCYCDYEEHAKGVCGRRRESISFFPKEDGRKPGFCAEKCSRESRCKYYSEWFDLGCRIFKSCSLSDVDGDVITSYVKQCKATLPACGYNRIPNNGYCAAKVNAILSWSDYLDTPNFCENRCSENPKCQAFSESSSECLLYESCEEATYITDDSFESFSKDCGIPTVSPTPNELLPVPTHSPIVPATAQPTFAPSDSTASPSLKPSPSPTTYPSPSPSQKETANPTFLPTAFPTNMPTGHPSQTPKTPEPTSSPASSPTSQPSPMPTTDNPTVRPTAEPSLTPTFHPTARPSKSPSEPPNASPTTIPSNHPTSAPTNMPSYNPTLQPTEEPTEKPIMEPSLSPSTQPTSSPFTIPTLSPTITATSKSPSLFPSTFPTRSPFHTPTNSPVRSPTGSPTTYPTISPTSHPTLSPTQILNLFDSIIYVAVDGSKELGCGYDVSNPCGNIDIALENLKSAELNGNKTNGFIAAILLDSGEYTGQGNRNIKLESTLERFREIHIIGRDSPIVNTQGEHFIQFSIKQTLIVRNLRIQQCAPAFIITGPESQVKFYKSHVYNCSSDDGGAFFIAGGAHGVIVDSTFHNNRALNSGGSFYITNSSTCVFAGTSLNENTAGTSGGALVVSMNSKVSIRGNSSFTGNSAPYGGAIVIVESMLSLEDSELYDNVAENDSGGAIYSTDSNVRLLSLKLEGLSSFIHGGAVYARCLASNQFLIEMTDLSYNGNSALMGSGGHVFVEGCNVHIKSSNFTSGFALSGGAVAIANSSVELDSPRFEKNIAVEDGGAIVMSPLTCTIYGSNVVFLSNLAQSGNGGAVMSSEYCDIIMRGNSKFSSNQAPNGGGGAIFQQGFNIAGGRMLQNIPWELNSEFDNNKAAYGENIASTPTVLCLAFDSSMQGSMCSAVDGTVEGNLMLNEHLKEAEITCGSSSEQKLTLSTLSGEFISKSYAVFFMMDDADNSYVLKDSEIQLEIMTKNSSALISPSTIYMGNADSCLSSVGLIAPSGSTIEVRAVDTINRLLPLEFFVEIGECDADSGRVLNEDMTCTVCPEGFFPSEENDSKCEECTIEGTVCIDGTIAIASGYWTSPELGTFLPCIIPYYCEETLSNSLVNQSNCIVGHSGTFCLTCESDRFSQGFFRSCEDCLTSAGLVFAVVFAAVAAACLITFLAVCSLRDEACPRVVKINGLEISEAKYTMCVGMIKVLFSHTQLMGLLYFVRVGWQAYMVRFFIFLQTISFAGFPWADCLFQHSSIRPFYATSILVFFLPLAAILISWLVRLISLWILRQQPTSDPREYTLTITIAILLVSYTLMLNYGFQFFACLTESDINGNGSGNLNILLADPEIGCSDNNHTSWAIGLGLVGFILFYGAGTLLFFLGLLYMYKRKQKGLSMNIGILHRSYLPLYYYWDVLLLMFHLLYTSLIVSLQIKFELQLFFLLLLLVVALYKSWNASPSLYHEINVLRLYSLIVIFLSLSFSVFLTEHREDSGYNVAINALVLALNLAFLLYSSLLGLYVVTLHSNSDFALKIRKRFPWRILRLESPNGLREPDNSKSSEKVPLNKPNNPEVEGTEIANQEKEKLKIGDKVVIANLTKRTEYNGRDGEILAYVEETNKYEIKLHDGTVLRLKKQFLDNPSANKTRISPMNIQDMIRGKEERIRQLREKITLVEQENAKLKREVNYLDGLNKGIIEGS